MVEGKIIQDPKSISSRYTIEINGEFFAESTVPSAMTVQEFKFRKNGDQVFHLTFDQNEGMKNMTREKKDQKYCIYHIFNFRNKKIGYLCERTDNALMGATNWGEIKYGHDLYEAYVLKDSEGLKVFVVESESGKQIALGKKNKNDYEMRGISEIALKILAYLSLPEKLSIRIVIPGLTLRHFRILVIKKSFPNTMRISKKFLIKNLKKVVDKKKDK